MRLKEKPSRRIGSIWQNHHGPEVLCFVTTTMTAILQRLQNSMLYFNGIFKAPTKFQQEKLFQGNDTATVLSHLVLQLGRVFSFFFFPPMHIREIKNSLKHLHTDRNASKQQHSHTVTGMMRQQEAEQLLQCLKDMGSIHPRYTQPPYRGAGASLRHCRHTAFKISYW